MPSKYTCNGGETSPNLQWSISSDAVKGFALIMEDPGAVPIVGYAYVHWNVFGIPANARELPEGASRKSMPAGSVEGLNDDRVARYSGPCPPAGNGTHHYSFTLYALNTSALGIDTNRAWRKADFERLYLSSIVQKVEMQATFSR